MSVEEEFLVLVVFDEFEMLAKEVGEEESEVEDEFLVLVLGLVVGSCDV